MGMINAPAKPWKLPSPRKAGILCLILTESALFTIFVVAYLFYIGKSLNPPYPHEILELPIWATICLLSSSATIVVAEKNFDRSRGLFNIWLLVTIGLGLAFLTYTAMEWHEFIFHRGLSIDTNVFGSTFYSLVGLHASHVIVGLFLMTLVLILSLCGKVANHQKEHVEMISWYWHFVDVVWVVVFIVVYIISRQASV